MPGQPCVYAVLREWESLERGDLPEAVFLDEETAALSAAGLPLFHRELLFDLTEDTQRDAPVAAGHPVSPVYGEQGPRVCGWLRANVAATWRSTARWLQEPTDPTSSLKIRS